MELFIKLTKWIGFFTAVPVGIYGLFLSIGSGPDGPHKSLMAHVVGLFLVAFAVCSYIPHDRLIKSAKSSLGASIILCLPVIMVFGLIVYVSIIEGVGSVFEGGGNVGFLVYIALLLPAPLSFISAWFANQALQRTSR